MFNLFYTLFKYKEKAQNDELGYYPEKVDVRAFPERRFLWTSRFLVVISCLSLCLTMLLGAILIFMIPMKKTKMLPLQIDYDKHQVTVMEPFRSIAFAGDLVTESILDKYITQRYTIKDDINELKQRLGENEFVYLASKEEIYKTMLGTEYPYFETLQQMGIRREVKTTQIYPVSFNFWQVKFDIIETGGNHEKPYITHWLATMRMTFKFAKYDNKEKGLINPFGITITTYDLSYLGSNVKAKREEQ